MIARRIALLVLVAAAGCSSRSVEEYCRAYYDTLALHDATCAVPPDIASATWQRSRDYECPAYAKLLAQGSIAYDAAQAEKCLEQIRSRGCVAAPSIGGADPCKLAITGRVPAGGGCFVGRDCVSGTFCTFKNDACPGTCMAYPGLGEPCAFLCTAGSFCSKGLCTAPAGEGEECGSPDHPACGDGLWCGALSNRCRSVGAVTGDRCEGQEDCAWGFVCFGVDSADGITGTCVKAKQPGEQCAVGECAAWDFCSAGKCAPLPRPGEWCGDGAPCAVGYCASGTCHALAKVGESCDRAQACATHLCDSSAKCAQLCSPP